MTALGKTLTFFALFLSLVWLWLAANAYVTQTNWKAEAARYQKSAKEAADAAAAERAAAEGYRKAGADQAAALAGQVRTAQGQIAKLDEQLTVVNAEIQARQQAAQASDAREQLSLANIRKLQNQVDQLNKLYAEAQDAVTKLTLVAEQSRQEAAKARIDADANQKRAETLEQRIVQINDRNEAGRGGGTGVTTRRVPVPQDFRGTVRATTPSGNSVLVEITPGWDAGLREGAQLDVYRSDRYLGTLTITRTEPKSAAGTFAPGTPGPLTGERAPKFGDQVGVLSGR